MRVALIGISLSMAAYLIAEHQVMTSRFKNIFAPPPVGRTFGASR